MIFSKFIKHRYYEFRIGNQTLSPVLQLSNFLMLAYLTINEIIPFYIFVPLFVVTLLVSMTFIGSKFRAHQMSTDINMGFEKATESGLTTYHIMRALHEIKPQNDDFVERMKHMKKIGDGKI